MNSLYMCAFAVPFIWKLWLLTCGRLPVKKGWSGQSCFQTCAKQVGYERINEIMENNLIWHARKLLISQSEDSTAYLHLHWPLLHLIDAVLSHMTQRCCATDGFYRCLGKKGRQIFRFWTVHKTKTKYFQHIMMRTKVVGKNTARHDFRNLWQYMPSTNILDWWYHILSHVWWWKRTFPKYCHFALTKFKIC